MFKILFMFGTRPELIKMAPMILEMSARGMRDSICIVNSGQHRELLDRTLELLDIKADHNLDVMVPGQSLNELCGRCLIKTQQLIDWLDLQDKKPHIIMAQGDTATAFIASLTAFHNKLKFFHLEAGLRTYNFKHPFPEEYYRRVISMGADLHFAPTGLAANNLLKEGIRHEKIVVCGNTVIDTLEHVRKKQPSVPRTLDAVKDKKNLVLITCHRRENQDSNLQHIIGGVKELAAQYADHNFIWVKHMNPAMRDAVDKCGLSDIPNVDLLEPLDYPDLLALYPRLKIILTDSGGIQEEAPSFKIPVLILRETTERMESVEKGFAFLCGANSEKIKRYFTFCTGNSVEITHNPYGDGKAAEKITDYIISYMQPGFNNLIKEKSRENTNISF
jgi:UDP-N-acetylglucosamine 2-epimerase